MNTEKQIEEWKTAKQTLSTMMYTLYHSKTDELKPIARLLGVSTSGRKSNIIHKIVEKINPDNSDNTWEINECGCPGIVITK